MERRGGDTRGIRWETRDLGEIVAHLCSMCMLYRKGRGEGGKAQESLFIACIDVSSEMLLYAQDSVL